MDRHCANALSLADWLPKQPQVARSIIRACQSHPGHAIAAAADARFRRHDLACGFTAATDAARRFLTRTKLFSLAESLGGVESLVCHPATMTHASIPAEIREARGVDDGLIRLSVGIEDLADLRADLQHAMG